MDEYSRYRNPKRFYRPSDKRWIAGVCSGLAERMDWDVSIIRILAIVSMITGVLSGAVFVAYIVAWIITPKRHSKLSEPLTKEEETFWQGVSDRPKVTLSNIRYKFMDLEERMQSIEKNVTSEEWRLRRQFRDLEQN